MICIPNGEPSCDKCPLKEQCVAWQKGLTDTIPVREKKIKRRKEKKTVFILEHDSKIALAKRKETGLLAGMYEFPNCEGHLTVRQVSDTLQRWGLDLENCRKIGSSKHIFSHVEWEMIGYEIKVKKKSKEFIWVNKRQMTKEYPIPTAFQFFKKQLKS